MMFYVGAAAILLAGATMAVATPADSVHRTTLQEQQFPPGFHTLTVKTIVDPGSAVAAHTHPGAEIAFVESGTATLTVAGETPRALASGDSFTIVPQTVHSLTNVGSGPLTVISTYVVERGQPVATPAR